MNKELLNFVRVLSENDKKNLCQKALKTSEEVGELAKAVLPFENAAGTLHRFSDRRKILENVVDVMLSAVSIAYDMKFSDEEIEEMMLEKSEKWQGIQVKESEVKFPLPYEIHVTIERPHNLESFKEICKEIGVKPIIIELEKSDEIIMQDVMTSSVHFGDNRSAYEEAKRIEEMLRKEYPKTQYNPPTPEGAMDSWFTTYEGGYNVVRTKVETVPWHPSAPSVKDRNAKMPEDCYFESHLRIVAKESDKKILQRIADNYGAHLSRNFFKKINADQYVIMMTLRSYDDNRENFQRKVEVLKKDLVGLNFVVDKVEIEFAVYDTKVNHDIAWIGHGA